MNNDAYYFPGERDFSISKAKRTDGRFISDSHYHDTYEIYYLVSGTRRQFVNHTIYDMTRGDLILIPKGAIHKTTAIMKNPHTRYLINFSEEYCGGICRDMGFDSVRELFTSAVLTVPETRREYVLSLFERMDEEYKEKSTDKYADIMIKNYLSELFVFISRCRKHQTAPQKPDNMSENRIQTAAKYIYDNYNKNLTLGEVASLVFMSESYFSKKFKSVTGLNFTEYLISTRIKAADEMLLNTKKPISAIAEECGFSDANYFGDVFKKKKGVSPNKYRKFKGKM